MVSLRKYLSKTLYGDKKKAKYGYVHEMDAKREEIIFFLFPVDLVIYYLFCFAFR